MSIDDVTTDQAEAFWVSLGAEEQRALCDIDARKHSPGLIAKLANAGMLFWGDEGVSTRLEGAHEGVSRSATDSVARAPRLGLAAELVRIIDRQT